MRDALRMPFRGLRRSEPSLTGELRTRRRRLFGDIGFARLVLLAVLVVVLSAIVHIATILAIPHFATRDAWSRITELAQPVGVTLLPRAVPGDEVLPGLDPAVVYGVCTYDLSEAPFAIVAAMPGDYWSIAFHTRGGAIFYAVNDEAATSDRFDIEIRNARQMRQFRLEYPDPDEEILTIEAPSDVGFALMRGLVSAPSERPRVEAAMAATVCENFTPPPPVPEAVGPPLPRPSPLR
ncbi:DUF1254 domain-containing protein [Microbaculum marinum]|uniref:DUF1254 domain-containing protein n=1 Tax=Microbaculum marinum TaxID=1764581 RepID=A0AAW9RPI6_9HYPH